MGDESALPNLGNFPMRALLTGAGFTKNWGGHLASEVWALLASGKCVRECPPLKAIFEGTVGSFEEAIEQAHSSASQVPSDVVRRFEAEIVQVFLDQEDRITTALQTAWPDGLEEMLSFFGSGPRDQGNRFEGIDSGYIFTLNQDIFVERITLNGHAFHQPVTPGVTALTTESALPWDDLRRNAARPHLRETHRVQDDLSGATLAGNLNYIKLHGSYEWRTNDGRDVLVLGGGKEQAVKAFPLLAAYLAVFRRVCSEPNLRLMVVGYGFRDPHINEVMADGIRNGGLKIFLVDPTGPQQTLSKLRAAACPFGPEIADAIDGWSTKPFAETFSGGRSPGRRPEYRRILRDFFDIELP